MDLSPELLARRIPEIAAAATRERLPLGEVWLCSLTDEPAQAAMAPPPPPEASAWHLLRPGETWGVPPGHDPSQPLERLLWGVAPHGGSIHWLRIPFALPEAWNKQHVRLALRWAGDGQASLEAIVYLEGAALAGLDEFHRSVLLPSTMQRSEALIRCTLPFPEPFGGAELQLRDEAIFRLGTTMRVLLNAAQTLAPSEPTRHDLFALLNQVYRSLDLRAGWQSEAFVASAHAALDLLDAALEQLASQVSPTAPQLLASGHAHLDVAWLWPLWRTRQKGAHTVATALHLMERYPEYYFSMSQPQVYAYLKQDDPALYERLRTRVAEGRLEPVGMMWIEVDCNLPSGESLVRQLTQGARFFAQEFPALYGATAERPGGHPHVVWLPDVFGYSAALPQILRLVGIDCFMTTKISWSQVNRFPHDTFRWRGVDGSEVLTHFVTASDRPVGHPADPQSYTYVGQMSAGEVAGTWRHYRQQALNRELLYLYGWGDGGGGPTEEMLEAARVLARVPGLPQVRPGRADRYFAELYQRVWPDERLPTWVGELYLEYHRGTYTSQAHVKQANRRSELLYREAEWLNAWATSAGGTNRQSTLDAGWQKILLNQFHDVLPGSSIALVYAGARADYVQIAQIGTTVATAALEELLTGQQTTENPPQGAEKLPQGAGNVSSDAEKPLRASEKPLHATEKPLRDAENLPQVAENLPHGADNVSSVVEESPRDAENLPHGAEGYLHGADNLSRSAENPSQVAENGAAGALLVLNALPWARHEVVQLPLGAGEAPPVLHGPDGAPLGTQLVEADERYLLAEVAVPSYGYTLLRRGTGSFAPRSSLVAERSRLENDLLRVELDERGEIASLYDKRAGRELVLSGTTINQLVAYEDRPLQWDAWDIDHFYSEKPYPVHELASWELVETGPLRSVIALTRRLGQSELRQLICLWHGRAQLDFVTEVDWQERQTLLRALFPLAINSDKATCEIQFGAVERPTHRNTSWEQARFEVCAQRWVELAEGDYGVALLNDGKYGHSLHNNTLGLSLLKGGIFPDPNADRGQHRFTYSLLPHAGDWRAAQVVRAAYGLNAPLRAVPLAGLPSEPRTRSLLSTTNEHVVVETVKVADDGDGLIVRLYEAHNQRGAVELRFERALSSAEEVDLLERPRGSVEVEGNCVRFAVRPFEIKTLRVRLLDA